MTISLAALLVAGAARADENRDNAKKHYPQSLVERPMILPPLMFQPTFEFNLSNRNPSGTTNGGVGESIGFGLDLGVVRGLQLGFFFAFPLHPVADFGDFVFNLQGGLGRSANLRLDLGAERIAGGGGHADSFIFGLGVPLKIKLHRLLAIVSGSTEARGFGVPYLVSAGASGFWLGAATQSNDIFALQVVPLPNSSDTEINGSLHLPIGLLIQPHRVVSFAVRTGYRFTFTTVQSRFASTTVLSHFVPLSFDLTVAPLRILDVGFTATIAGFIAGDVNPGTPGSVHVSGGWVDLQRYDFFVAVRF